MFNTIPVWDLDQYMDQNNQLMIIDLRTRFMYARSHIKGAVNLPFERMEEWKEKLPRDKTLIFYCSRGSQSMLICRNLEPLGYHVINIANGIAYYKGKYMVRG
ncbi:rhodanese-like domain-containing protein [Clostridium sp. E02]|uniref:rhodanese-like domain-containing protein n=1 Tax=Clostridium sp. E02 TaxID=2487134 RepID=UPI000F52EFB6|nr:rhodanese-like domain-containing protein [Clostridium sp. E02]